MYYSLGGSSQISWARHDCAPVMPSSSAFDEVTLAVNLCFCYFNHDETVNTPLFDCNRLNISTKCMWFVYVSNVTLKVHLFMRFLLQDCQKKKFKMPMFTVTYFFTKVGSSSSLRVFLGWIWEDVFSVASTVTVCEGLSSWGSCLWKCETLDVVINHTHTVVFQHKTSFTTYFISKMLCIPK